MQGWRISMEDAHAAVLDLQADDGATDGAAAPITPARDEDRVSFFGVYDGHGGIPGCAWTMKKGTRPGFTLYDLSDRLRLRGWQVPAYPMPEHRTNLVVQRVLARLGLSRDLAGLLLDDLKRAVKHFAKNPSARSSTHEDAGGYHHG